MLGYDQQIDLANAMAKGFADTTNEMMRASTAFWAQTTPPESGKSWYRNPAPNPFDWSTWAMPMSNAAAPWAAWGTNFANPMMPPAFQPWSAIASVANTMATVETVQANWASLFAGWPLAQVNAVASVVSPSEPVTAYRSSGGHAVAQVSLAHEPRPKARNSKLH
jgi:hypothetical protein